MTRGYFSASRYLVHVVPPAIDNGIWKNTLKHVHRCYEGFWKLAARVRATRVAIQFIGLGRAPSLNEIAMNILLGQANRFRSSLQTPPIVSLFGQDTLSAFRLAEALEVQRRPVCLRGDGGLRPAGKAGGSFSPGTLGSRNNSDLTDRAFASRSNIATVGFSSPRSRRLT